MRLRMSTPIYTEKNQDSKEFSYVCVHAGITFVVACVEEVGALPLAAASVGVAELVALVVCFWHTSITNQSILGY